LHQSIISSGCRKPLSDHGIGLCSTLDVNNLDVTAAMTPAFVAYNMTGHTLARAVIRPTFAV
jgi:hypothetical protein